MNLIEKRRLYDMARAARPAWVLELEHGTCLYWTLMCSAVLRSKGLRPVVQAGTMSWPMNIDAPAPEPTHFTYQWSPNDLISRLSVSMNQLPEMHVWIGLVETQEIVDFSVGELPAKARTMGFTWKDSHPPDFLWASRSTMPKGVFYEPNEQTTRVAMLAMQNLIKETVS